ncbi:MAG: hypothetical protein QOG53_1126 [Frankiales bacterium]|nr:hypothetical protein [Frankiales bacterium]
MVTTVPALALAGWLIASLPLLLANSLNPLPTIVLAAAVTTALVGVVWRAHPGNLGHSSVALGLTVAIAGGFAALAWSSSSDDVVVRRDPGVYAQTADWLSDHGSLPIPAHADAFGDVAGLTYSSPGFYQQGNPPELTPQFMTGTALAMTPAGWANGLRGITHANAIIGAFALLAVAGLAARLVGPWASPVAAMTLLCVYPVLHQAQSAYSEPAAQLLMFGGLSLLVDARQAVARAATRLHAVAGLLLGLVTLVRIDALIDLVPMIAVIGVIALTGRREHALAIANGVFLGIALGLLDGIRLTRPYLNSLSGELSAIAAAAVLVAVVVALAAWQRARIVRWKPRWVASRWPEVAGGSIVLLAAAAYFIRPLVEQPRFKPGEPIAEQITNLQADLGLANDGPRTYVEHSMHWLTWWLGAPGVVVAVIGLALLARRVLRTGDDPWLPLLLVLLGTTAVVLARPSITPDHPWADRRFVPVVFPGLVVVATWVIFAAMQRARRRTHAVVAGVVGLAALLVAPLVASAPLWGHSTERGEIGLVERTCAALPERAAIIVAGTRGANELPQVLRAGCNVPVAIASVGQPQAVTAAARRARDNGFTPVVVAETEGEAAVASGSKPRRVVALNTREDAKTLTKRPTRTSYLRFELWFAEPH